GTVAGALSLEQPRSFRLRRVQRRLAHFCPSSARLGKHRHPAADCTASLPVFAWLYSLVPARADGPADVLSACRSSLAVPVFCRHWLVGRSHCVSVSFCLGA